MSVELRSMKVTGKPAPSVQDQDAAPHLSPGGALSNNDVIVDMGVVNEGYDADDSMSPSKTDKDNRIPKKAEEQSGSLLREPADKDERSASSKASSARAEGCWQQSVTRVQAATSQFFNSYGKVIRRTFYALMLLGYGAYFAWSLYYEFGTESSIRLLWMTLVAVALVVITLLRDNFGEWIYDKILAPPVDFISRHFTIFKWLFLGCSLAGIIIFLAVDVGRKNPYNLLSISGYVIFIFLLFLFSANPARVKWRPVLWGLALQFIFALLVLRTSWGYEAFKWLGDRVQEFMEYSDAGAEFVFGENFEEHFFAFKVLPIVIFFSSTISVLYYLGTMQSIISKIAWLMQKVMGTTAAESVNAAGNIFIGQTEAPLLIRPMIDDMTSSELHAVMVGGYATIAGSVMATYISIGVSANHLITASVMAAPCALGTSKLFYPETQQSKTTAENVAKMENSQQRNVIEAASVGASAAISLVANIAVNLMAFISLLEFLNTVLTWMGHRAGLWPPEYPELTFQLMCSYLFWPFAFLMGVAKEDCRKVAELIGVKTFINEFVAYTDLSVIIQNSEIFAKYNGTYEYIQDDIYLKDINTTLIGGIMQERSITISTYALCGFANLSSLGTVMGALGAMVPDRRAEISRLAMRALVAGTIVSFLNACMAGLLYTEDY